MAKKQEKTPQEAGAGWQVVHRGTGRGAWFEHLDDARYWRELMLREAFEGEDGKVDWEAMAEYGLDVVPEPQAGKVRP